MSFESMMILFFRSATTSLAAVAESQPKTRNGVFGKIKKGFGALTEKIRSGF